MIGRGVGARLGILACLVSVGGCQTVKSEAQAQKGLTVAERPALTDLELAADRIATELATLRQIEQARTAPAPDPIDEAMVPPELRRPTSFTWVGPVDGVLREVAAQIGYDYTGTGAAPELDAIVEVHAKGEPLVRVLQEIGLQVRKWGTVVVDPDARRIELRFDRRVAEGAPVEPGPQLLVPEVRR